MYEDVNQKTIRKDCFLIPKQAQRIFKDPHLRQIKERSLPQ